MTRVAGAFRAPSSRVVEHALAAYCDEFNALVAEQQRLRDERPRVEQCANGPRVAAFNHDLTLYNERASRFLQQRVGQTGQRVQS